MSRARTIADYGDGVAASDLASTLDLTGKTVTLPSGVGGSYVHLNTTSGTSDVTAVSLSYFDTAVYNKYMIHFRFESDERSTIRFRLLDSGGELTQSAYSGFTQSRRSDQSSGINTDRFDNQDNARILGFNDAMQSSSMPGTSFSSVIYLDLEGEDSYNFMVFGSGALMGDDSASHRYGYQNSFGTYYNSSSPTVTGIKFYRGGGNYQNYTASIYGLIES